MEMITIPMKLEIVSHKQGGWRYRLQSVETKAITFDSADQGQGSPFPTPATATTAAHERLQNFNQQYRWRIKMIL